MLQILDDPVPQTVVQLVDVLKIMDIPVPEQVIEVPKIFSQDSVPQRVVLQGSQLVEQFGVPLIMQLKFQQSFVVSVDVPQIPFIDRVVDISVASQRLVPQCMLCTRPEIPWCSSGKDVDVPVCVQRQVHGSVSTQTGEVPQCSTLTNWEVPQIQSLTILRRF